MNKGQGKPHRQQQSFEFQQEPLLVSDVVRYLSGLAKLHEEDKTGNPELSEGLRQVAKALRPYADCPVPELTDAIKKRALSAANSKTASARIESELPPELESIGQDGIARILDDESYTKQQIAELGARRFGISRSKLERISKKDAQDSVRAALEHEKSLDAISREARKGGMARLA